MLSSATFGSPRQTPAVKFNEAIEKTVVPYVIKHCVQCHGPKKKNASLALHVYTDEKSILKDRKRWIEVIRMLNSGEMPPEKQPRPKLDDTEKFLKVIHDIFTEADSKGPLDPGRVTIRRLNRRVQQHHPRPDRRRFQACRGFPADDVGHGFDNIGDVLTVSPVLMERYLAAAETITQQAIVAGELPKPRLRTASARFTEPSVPNPDMVGRFVRTQTKVPLHTLYNLTQEGEFTARIRGYGDQAGDEPVKLALIDGKQEHVFEVKKAGDRKNPLALEIKLELKKGPHALAAVLLNEFKNADNERAPMSRCCTRRTADTPPGVAQENHGPQGRPSVATRCRRFSNASPRRRIAGPRRKRKSIAWSSSASSAEERRKNRGRRATGAAGDALSPKFLFRVELDHRPDSKDAHPIDEYQLASRLSYFLWSTMPDDELFDLAAKKQLHANLDAASDSACSPIRKSYALVENFAAQWLQLRLLKAHHSPDASCSPNSTTHGRKSMINETELFFPAIIREDRSILDLIDSDFTFMNERLARHYGIVDTNGNRVGQKKSRSRVRHLFTPRKSGKLGGKGRGGRGQ